jgi:paraquat-inducible protein A
MALIEHKKHTALLACPSCDLVFDVGGMPDGSTATCSRCGTFLTRRCDDAFERVQAYSTAALIMLALACAFPFMQFSRAGFENTMTLPQTVLELWANNRHWLALIVAAFIILIPALVMAMALVFSTTLTRGANPTWLRPLARRMFHLLNWSMAEVFFVGVLVSLVKIAHMATVVLGISFWSYAAFTILFVKTLTNLDRFQSWRHIEALS